MFSRAYTVSALALVLLALGCSTDDQCASACVAWEDQCGYSDYDFGICFDECKSDGDWSGPYVSCVTSADSCAGVEICDPF